MDSQPLDKQSTHRRRIPPEMGEFLEEFGLGQANLAAGVILTYLCFLGAAGAILAIVWNVIYYGGDLPEDARRGFTWGKAAILAIIAFAALGGGVFFKFYVGYLRGQRIFICTNGVYFSMTGGGHGWAWQQIAAVRELHTLEHFPLRGPAKYLVPMGRSVSYTIVRQDGSEFAVDKDQVNRLDRFGEVLKEQAGTYGFGWDVVDN